MKTVTRPAGASSWPRSHDWHLASRQLRWRERLSDRHQLPSPSALPHALHTTLYNYNHKCKFQFEIWKMENGMLKRKSDLPSASFCPWQVKSAAMCWAVGRWCMSCTVCRRRSSGKLSPMLLTHDGMFAICARVGPVATTTRLAFRTIPSLSLTWKYSTFFFEPSLMLSVTVMALSAVLCLMILSVFPAITGMICSTVPFFITSSNLYLFTCAFRFISSEITL